MKKIIAGLSLLLAASAGFATDVGVSINIGQPGLYGRVDIGRVQAPPVLVYQQPVWVQRPAVVVQRSPIYLHVPPGHSKNWGRYCGRYNACGQPVYFVQDNWYRTHYAAPRPAPHREWRDDRGRDRDHHHGRRDDRHRDNKHGHGHGNGHGRNGRD